MTEPNDSKEWKSFRVPTSIRMRDLASSADLLKAMQYMERGEELYLADILGIVDKIVNLESPYIDDAGNPVPNILLQGHFEVEFPDDRCDIVSGRLWLPPHDAKSITRLFDRLPAGETLPVILSVYAVKAARQDRELPYYYRVRPGGHVQQSARELRRVKSWEQLRTVAATPSPKPAAE